MWTGLIQKPASSFFCSIPTENVGDGIFQVARTEKYMASRQRDGRLASDSN